MLASGNSASRSVTPLVTRRVSWVYAIFLWYLPSPKGRKIAQGHFVSWGQGDFEFIPFFFHSYHKYTIFKQIELESPDWLDFVES